MKDSEFDDLLRGARGDFPVPASFHREVWNRINEAERSSRQVEPFFQSVIAAFVRPWGAAAGIAAMAVLGLWLGDRTVPDAKDSRMAYAESISPFAQEHGK
jgi:hypothetical protein